MIRPFFPCFQTDDEMDKSVTCAVCRELVRRRHPPAVICCDTQSWEDAVDAAWVAAPPCFAPH